MPNGLFNISLDNIHCCQSILSTVMLAGLDRAAQVCVRQAFERVLTLLIERWVPDGRVNHLRVKQPQGIEIIFESMANENGLC